MPTPEFEIEVLDCLEGMARLPEQSVDLIVTSPPYNLGIQYGKYKDDRSAAEYLDWCVRWASEVRRVMKEGGSFFLNLGACPSNPLLPHELILRMREAQLVLQNTFHWIKSISITTRDGETISAGHFKPLNSERFVNDCHEYVFHLTREGKTPLQRRAVGVPYMDKSNINRWAHTGGSDLRCRGNNWFIPYETIMSRAKERPHPATFPTELAVFCIKLHGARPDLVMMDPFLGIGHSAQAAKKCGVGRFIGFDIDADYVAVARQNLSLAPAAELVKPRNAPEKTKARAKKASKEQPSLFELPDAG